MRAPRPMTVALPAGPWVDGVHRSTVTLRPLAASDEAFLLELDDDALPVERVTTLLARCVTIDGAFDHAVDVDAGVALARRLTAGDRVALLLHLRRATLGERLAATLSCPHCQLALEVALDVGDLLLPPYADTGPEHARTLDTAEGALEVVLRRPDGADLEAAAHAAAAGVRAPGRVLLARCTRTARLAGEPLAPATIPDSVADAVSEEIERLDPQAELLLDTPCPGCEGRVQALLDAGAFVLGELAARAQIVRHEVHTLALHYHWSERDILALGAHRRRRYLELLGAT